MRRANQTADLVLRAGDTVSVIWSGPEAGTWQDWLLVSRPQGAGDLWELQDPETGDVFAVNPYHDDLMCIRRKKEL